MTEILFVTELQVWPPYGGEKIQASHMIASLSRLARVTVLAPQPPDDCPLLAQVQGWHNLPGVPASFRRRLAASPSVVIACPAWRRQIDVLLESLHPQIVWFNYGHWGQYAGLVHQNGARTVMHTHNVQSRLAWQGLASRPLTRWHLYYAVRAPLESLHERMLFRCFDRVISVSERDRHTHAHFVGEDRSLFLPNYLDEMWYHINPSPARDADLIVMTGNFGAFQNQVGAGWLIEKIWPRVRAVRPTARLLLVGGAPVGWRKRTEVTPGVACTGSVSTVAPYLRQAKVAVAPLQHGSGTRFKILEALACETPLVSTRKGAEGIALADGIHARLADTPEAFAQALIELLQDREQGRRLAANGLALLRFEYSADANITRLQQIIAGLLGEQHDGL